MARLSSGFGFGRGGMLRPPISPGMQKELTVSPMQTSGQMMKTSQFPGPKVSKINLPKQLPGRGPRGNPFKSQPFYGE